MKVNWYKISVFAAIAIAIFFFGRKCGSGGSVVANDTVSVRIDTLPGIIQVVIDTHYVPKPYKVVDKVVETKVVKFDHFKTDTVYTHPDPHGIKRFMLDSAFYSDTVNIDHGTAIINDTITENRIAGRGIKSTIQIPIIKETVTIFQPPRNIVYLGFSGTGSKQNFFYSIGTDLSLKTRNDRIYSAGVNLTRDNQVLYEGGFKIPLKFSKK